MFTLRFICRDHTREGRVGESGGADGVGEEGLIKGHELRLHDTHEKLNILCND